MKNIFINLFYVCILLSLTLVSCNTNKKQETTKKTETENTVTVDKKDQFKPGYDIYNNERFQFQVEYPTDLLRAKGESENKDGQRFISKEGDIYMVAYASYNVLEETMSDLINQTTEKSEEILSTDKKDDRYTIKGIEKQTGFEFFQYVRNKPNYNINYYIYIRFPKEDEAKIEPIFNRMVESFNKSLDNNNL